MLSLYTRAAIRTLQQSAHEVNLPDVQLASKILPDAEHVAQYNILSNWDAINTPFLHPLYFQVLSVSMQLQMMVERRFPFKPIGLVHIANQLNVQRLPTALEEFDLITKFGKLYKHRRGLVFEVITSACQDGSDLVTGTSFYLTRSHAEISEPKVQTLPLFKDSDLVEVERNEKSINQSKNIANFNFSNDIGRRYAKVSGDYNPIHLWPITANLFGFKQAIAHGMLTKAMTISALFNHDQTLLQAINESQPLNIAACFKMPVVLPTTCKLELNTVGDNKKLHLYSEGSQRPKSHLIAQVNAID